MYVCKPAIVKNGKMLVFIWSMYVCQAKTNIFYFFPVFFAPFPDTHIHKSINDGIFFVVFFLHLSLKQIWL